MARVKVEDLIPGTLVDLEKDPFADPNGDNPLFPYELECVYEVELETPDCVLVYFGFDAVGFPLGHEVTTVLDEPLSPSSMGLPDRTQPRDNPLPRAPSPARDISPKERT